MAFIWGVLLVCALLATEATPVDEVVPGPTPDTLTTPAQITTTEVPATSSTITDVRLPSSIIPVRYLIRLQPFINGNFTIKGSVEITISVSEKTNNITLHIADIITKNETIRLNPVDDLNGPGLKIEQHRYDNDREFYIAKLEKDLTAGKQYVLYMEFEGLLNDKLKGFYRSEYTDANNTRKMLATTQFQPTDARRAFPCFDEPALKAEFEVFLGRQTNMSSISNMPRIETTPIEGQPGWVWDHFNTSVPMSTYLVAFVVSDFTFINSTSNPNTLFRVWAREEAIDQANYSRQIGPDVLTWFEGYFDIPFPLPKQDMIALPDFSAGAMENWGLITYRETALLYDPAVSSASNKQRVAKVVAHELAHQWFGDLVTPSWWTDLWLNEGFASYLEYLGVDAVEPSWKMLEQFSVLTLHTVFALDCLESSHPISIPVGHPDEITEIFDRISYNKGASIIRMMNHFLSEPTLRKGLTNFLNKFKYSSAEQDDLWLYLTQQAHTDGTLPKDITVKTIMDTWTLQMGYPVITVTRQGDGTAKLTQERFLIVQNINSRDTHDYKWWVPISFTTEEDNNFNQTKPSSWMNDTESVKTISGMPTANKWAIFNIQQTGYYRVNYDIDNWNMIIRQLKTDHTKINVINRAQIIDDATNLARAGLLTYDIALDVLSYLNKETEYVPWKAALDNLKYIKNMLQRTASYGAFKRYLLSLLVPLYEAVGFDDNIRDPHLDQLKRVKALAWTCDLGYKDCTQKSVQLFAQWMADPRNNSIVSPNLKSIVYCHAIAEGGENEWKFGWTKFQESNVAAEKVNLLSALGCTKHIWILSKYLDLAFTADSGVRKQDASIAYVAVASNDFGQDLAWNYLRDKWAGITNYYGSGVATPGRLIQYVSNKFSSNLMKKELVTFRDDNVDSLTAARRTMAQSIERTANNVDWRGTRYQVIVDWLRKNGYEGIDGL